MSINQRFKITAASDAVQRLARVLASAYQALGIRVLCLRLSGIPESRTITLTSEANARTMGIPLQSFNAMAANLEREPFTLTTAAKALVSAAAVGSAAQSGIPFDVEPSP